MEISHAEPINPQDRISYYQNQVEQLQNRYSRSFTEFTENNEELVAKGDDLIRTHQATDYNILLQDNDMPLTSEDPLIFYNNYLGRPRHFGLLLAEMERDGVISPEQVRFGVKASKVVYGEVDEDDSDGWDIDTENEQLVDFQRIDTQGKMSQTKVDQTVEAVAIFSPSDANQAANIALFLNEKASSDKPDAIEGSWEVPDIRATAILRGALSMRNFQEVIANVLQNGDTRLIAARQVTRFPEPWQAKPAEFNRKLATYLAGEGVTP